MPHNLLDSLPEWAIFLLTSLVIVVALELGFRAGRWLMPANTPEGEDSSGLVIGSILGLLSFLLAFTFGISASHYESRRQVVLEEANAIGTAWLRTDLIGPPQGAEIAGLLVDYTALRLRLAKSNSEGPEEFRAAMAESQQLQDRIWTATVAATKASPTPITTSFVAAINEVFDVGSKRLMTGVRTKIPVTIWLCLFTIATIGVASAGLVAARKSSRRPLLLPGMVITLATVITLIVDLDNPQQGFLKSSQAPMEDLLANMQR